MKKNNRSIEYIDDIHCYLVDGVITPSVTQIMGKIIPSTISMIPPRILQAKAQHGTVVHNAIQCYEEGQPLPTMDVPQDIAFEEYKLLKEEHQFTVISQEEIVAYKDIYCGRFDMILDNNKFERCLADIKTTAKYNENYLSLQLSLYELAYEDTHGVKNPFEKFYCIWIPKKDKAQFIEVPKWNRRKLLRAIHDIEKNESN